MFAEFKPTAVLEKDNLPEYNAPFDIGGALDPFLSVADIDSSAEDWMELLADSWGLDWTASDTSSDEES
ncbi:MAG TPA: hypothetical protein V6C63_00940 [Allocoleopsis sp.]